MLCSLSTIKNLLQLSHSLSSLSLLLTTTFLSIKTHLLPSTSPSSYSFSNHTPLYIFHFDLYIHQNPTNPRTVQSITMKDRMCELCDHQATLYCPSDSAFLCSRCDSRVHGANFLVARHVRQPLCSNCKAISGGPIYGDSVRSAHWLCSSCSADDDLFSDEDLSSSCSSLDSACSACVSSTESLAGTATTTTKVCQQRSGSSVTENSQKYSKVPVRLSGRFTNRRVQRLRATSTTSADARMEGTFVNWYNKLGMSSGDSAAVVSSASYALGFCLSRLSGVPLRVSLAASFWFGVRLCRSRCQNNLRRVEEISGVPAKLIMAVDAKLRRELRVRRARPELEEGWAEC